MADQESEIQPPQILELRAMETIAKAIAPLSPQAVARVLAWAKQAFNAAPMELAGTPLKEVKKDAESSSYGHVGELFAVANPATDAEKALVVAYWHQVHQGSDEWASAIINADLKQLGYGVGNITDAISSLQSRSPSLVIQLRKSGSSRQSRKTYKLTTAGIQFVKGMLAKSVELEA